MGIEVDEQALDTFLENDGEAPSGETETETEAPAEAESETSLLDEEPSADQDTFDRAYVEKLRKESANYRSRAKKYQEAFDGYEDEAVSEWLTLANTLKSDPKAAAERFSELADAIRQEYGDEVADKVEEKMAEASESGETEQPLTKAQVEQMFAERERMMDERQRITQIESDAKSLGYEKGSDEYDMLLFTASRTRDGSIQKAHEALEAKKQSIIDKYIEEVGGKPAPKTPGKNTGSPPGQDKEIGSFKEANEALDEWLSSQFGN